MKHKINSIIARICLLSIFLAASSFAGGIYPALVYIPDAKSAVSVPKAKAIKPNRKYIKFLNFIVNQPNDFRWIKQCAEKMEIDILKSCETGLDAALSLQSRFLSTENEKKFYLANIAEILKRVPLKTKIIGLRRVTIPFEFKLIKLLFTTKKKLSKRISIVFNIKGSMGKLLGTDKVNMINSLVTPTQKKEAENILKSIHLNKYPKKEVRKQLVLMLLYRFKEWKVKQTKANLLKSKAKTKLYNSLCQVSYNNPLRLQLLETFLADFEKNNIILTSSLKTRAALWIAQKL